MTSATTTVLVFAALMTLADPVRAQAPVQNPNDGFALLEASCARCHAIGKTGASPLEGAPPLRTLSRKYPLENLSEALAEGIMTGHPDMPQFAFQPTQIDAILAYLQQIAEP